MATAEPRTTDWPRPKVLLRLTRHAFLDEQREYLEKRFGVLTLVQHPHSVTKDDMLVLKERYQPDIVEVVLPVYLVNEAIRIFHPAPVVKAVMKREVLEGGRVSNTFSHYEVLKRVSVETERL